MDPVLSSILFLTLLLIIGLVFFIRASTKDRTELAGFSVPSEAVSVLNQLQDYFEARAYQIQTLNLDESEIVFSGIVRASVLLAVFLSALAAISLGCIALVLSILFPNTPAVYVGVGSVLLSPLAGLFYWRGATRPEVVKVTVTPIAAASVEGGLDGQNAPETRISISAHRDELAAIQAKMNLKPWSAAV
jgi:hypothetical protein